MTEESNRVVRIAPRVGVILDFQPDGVWNQLRYTILGRKVYVGEDFLKRFSEWGNTLHTVGGTFWWAQIQRSREKAACLPPCLAGECVYSVATTATVTVPAAISFYSFQRGLKTSSSPGTL